MGGFTDGFIGHPYGDMPDHVWGNEWFAQELGRDDGRVGQRQSFSDWWCLVAH